MEAKVKTMEEVSLLQGVDYTTALEREYNEDLYDDDVEDTYERRAWCNLTSDIPRHAKLFVDCLRRNQNA